MLLDNWFPFYDVSKTLDEVDRLFNTVNQPLGLRSVPRGTFPAINVYDEGEKAVLVAEVPGVDPKTLDISVLNDTVILKGERPDEANEAQRYYRRERVSGEFTRTITLPDPINQDTVKADYTNGVLKITMEKAEAAKAKRIPVKA